MKQCYICNSQKHVDNHHYDCEHGEISPETVPLCRRCHRTYHDLGVDWFEDEYLDRAIEIENRRREIIYNNLKGPVRPLELLKREDIQRSDYWYKKHGIKREGALPSTRGIRTPAYPFRLPRGEPLCGWDWVNAHLYDLIDWVPRLELRGPGVELAMDIDNTAKLKDAVKVLRGLKEVVKV